MFLRILLTLALGLASIFPVIVFANKSLNIPILCYHNLNPTKVGSMNMTPDRFESQMKYLKDNGFTIIPLQDAVAYLQGKKDRLPAKSVVVTVDDGWKSVYTYMFPIIKKYNFPVTLFIYPQTISQGKNVLSWDDLKELKQTGLFDVQSHTYDHPNFKKAKRRMSSESYGKYVSNQLTKSKKILDEKLNLNVTLLAWPFGIYDGYLEQAAAKAGYEMAFTIDYRAANRSFKPEAQPRFMIITAQSMNTFKSIVNQASK